MIREPLLDKSAEYENNYNRNIMLIIYGCFVLRGQDGQ